MQRSARTWTSVIPNPRACTAILLFATPALAQAEVKDLVRALGDEDGRTRSRAYRQLRSHKTPEALALLVKALPSYTYGGQTLGLSLVQAFPVDRSRPAMRRFLTGPPSFLRLGAAVWLNQRGEPAALRHVPLCLRAPRSPTELSGMLGRLWNIKSVPVLEAIRDCLSPKLNVAGLDPALRALQRGQATFAISDVEKLLASPGLDADRRALTAAFLVTMGRPKFGQVLAESLGKMKAFSRLATLLREASKLDKAVLQAILDFAEKGRGHNVRYALELLARHDHRAAIPKIREMLSSEDQEISKAAFQALIKMGDGLQPKQLEKLLRTSRAPRVRLSAADALRRMDNTSGIDFVLSQARAPGPLRADAVQILGKFRDRRVVLPLIETLVAGDRNVRTHGSRGLAAVLRTLFPYRRFDLAAAGFDPAAGAAARKAAVARLRQWWRDNQNGK